MNCRCEFIRRGVNGLGFMDYGLRKIKILKHVLFELIRTYRIARKRDKKRIVGANSFARLRFR